MVTAEQVGRLVDGGVVIGGDGDTIGKVGEVYLDDQSGEPSWVTVTTGWFGTSESFVPLAGASVEGDTLRVPVDKDTVKGAPNKEAGGALSEQDEDELYRYYGLEPGTPADGFTDADRVSDAGQRAGTPAGDTGDAPVVGGDEYLTRSEEQLHVGTEKVRTGRARLRKFVVTEQQSVTVPVSREEVRLEREPINAGDRVVDADISEAEHEVVLTEDRLVVNKETVPVEKVRLGTETVTEQREVTEGVRKEQVEFDTDVPGQDSRGRVDAGAADAPRR